MFGRLFGVILATILESRGGNMEKTSDGQTDTQSLISALLSRLIPTGKSNEDQSRAKQVSGTEGNVDTGQRQEEPVESEDSELQELKRRLWGNSKSDHKESEPAIDLIRRSTSFFKAEGDFTYRIYPFTGTPVFAGLICQLGKCCGGNPHDNGIICAIGTPDADHPLFQPKNVADLHSDSYFFSTDAPGRSICYDFKDMRVAVTHYILRLNNQQTGGYHLRSWVIEGSVDGPEWTELDHQENEGLVSRPNSICAFAAQQVIESRFIRLRATSLNWEGNNRMFLEAFDVFGGLRVPNPVKRM
jgi:hypothetical protein